ncbi:hypothetical protein ABGB08_51825 [Acrocarpospora sp. B8E8]
MLKVREDAVVVAAAPFDWIPVLVSAGSLALGAALTMVSQSLNDLRARRRELIARRDQFRLQRDQEDREDLKLLASLIADDHMFLYKVIRGHRHGPDHADVQLVGLMTSEQAERNNEFYTQIVPLFQRCRSWPASDAIQEYMDGVVAIQLSKTHGELARAWDSLNEIYQSTQGRIGEELRRDPLDEIGMAKWRIRRRRKRELKAHKKDMALKSGASQAAVKSNSA